MQALACATGGCLTSVLDFVAPRFVPRKANV
jgi:hypothetical protein